MISDLYCRYHLFTTCVCTSIYLITRHSKCCEICKTLRQPRPNLHHPGWKQVPSVPCVNFLKEHLWGWLKDLPKKHSIIFNEVSLLLHIYVYPFLFITRHSNFCEISKKIRQPRPNLHNTGQEQVSSAHYVNLVTRFQNIFLSTLYIITEKYNRHKILYFFMRLLPVVSSALPSARVKI